MPGDFDDAGEFDSQYDADNWVRKMDIAFSDVSYATTVNGNVQVSVRSNVTTEKAGGYQAHGRRGWF